MFSPLFALIPIAHSAVEETGKTNRVIKIVAVVSGCTLLSAIVSILHARGMKFLFGLSFLPITDFSKFDPSRFVFALLFVSLISFFIFVLSKEIIKMPPSGTSLAPPTIGGDPTGTGSA